jgi:halocyanin-like protein
MVRDELLVGRRTVLRATGATMAGTAIAGCSSGAQAGNGDGSGGETPTENDDDGGSDGGSGSESFGGWMADVGNYDGVVNATEQGDVTVRVGTEGNGGYFAFDPAAVRIPTGTTVVWEWTGEGGSHNVEADDGSFESELTDEAGHTFEHAFDGEGTYRYSCVPHEAMGMKGVVVVE